MKSAAASVDSYLAELPDDRRTALAAVRAVVLEHLPAGFEEGMQYGMIGYYVPLERYPVTYNGEPWAGRRSASQKRHMSLYLMGIYAEDDASLGSASGGRRRGRGSTWARAACDSAARRKLALDVVGEAIARTSVDDFIAAYERQQWPRVTR